MSPVTRRPRSVSNSLARPARSPGEPGSSRPFRSSLVALAALAVGLVGAVAPATPTLAETRNQASASEDVNCNLDGLHQRTGPVSTCDDITITTQVLVNGVDQPPGHVLAVGDTVTVRLTVAPRGGHDAFYEETVDGIRNNAPDIRFVVPIGLPGQTGTLLSTPSNVQMSRTDNGDRGNGPAINCLAHNGQGSPHTSDPLTPVALAGPAVGGNQMSATATGTALTAVWDYPSYDRCVNVLSNNGVFPGFLVQFDQVVEELGVVPVVPTWNLGRVSLARDNGSRQINWGSNADMALTLPAALPGPNAVPDSALVDSHYPGQAATSVTVPVLANDTGSGTLRITAVSATTAGGTVSCGALPSTGTCTYSPPQGHSGADTFTYTVSDDNGSTTAQATLVVKGNGTPVAADDVNTTTLGTAVSGSVATNDRDPDDDPLTWDTAWVSGPANGTATLSATGDYTYTPAAGFFGDDQMTYEVCDQHPMVTGPATSRCAQATLRISVSPGTPPSAVADSGATDTDAPTTIDILANDTVGDAGPLSLTFAGADSAGVTVAGGNVVCDIAGCTYTPPAGYSGSDAFGYTVTDAAGRTASATVTVLVVGNAAPVTLARAEFTTQDGDPVTGDLADNVIELDSDPVTWETTPVVVPTLGSVVLGADGTFTYTPDPGASGSDSFTYRVCDDHVTVDGSAAPACADGVVNITITATPPPPVVAPIAVEDGATTNTDIPVQIDVRANDTDPDGSTADLSLTFAGFGGVGGATQAGGEVTCDTACTYTPPMGFAGLDAFTYTVTDGDGATASAIVLVTVVGNRAPLAADDFGITPVDTPLEGDVAANDVDLDGDSLIFGAEPVVEPTNGTVEIAADGTFAYTPDDGFTGSDSFVYEVCDDFTLLDGTAAPACARATVTVLVGLATLDDIPDPDDDGGNGGNGGTNGGGSGGSGSGGTGTTGGGSRSPLARTGIDLQRLLLLGLLLAGIGGATAVGTATRRRSRA